MEENPKVSFKEKFSRLSRAKKTVLIFTAGIFSIALFTLIINLWVILSARNHIYTDMNQIPPRTVILVLGSQTIGTRLSPVLEDRVLAGIRLMQINKGDKLLLSGDHGKPFYDEVTAMRLYVQNNAPFIREEDIFLDLAGFSTWDSMYRARDVFQVEDILIVTQEFHISRAVCIARSLGIDAVGFSVNQERFAGNTLRNWHIREYFARLRAFYSIVFQPKPSNLGGIIPITGDGRASWN